MQHKPSTGAIKANEYRIQESIPPCSLYLFMNPYPVQWFIPVSSARGGDSIAMEIENLIGLPETSAEKPSINQFINDIAKQ